MDTYGVVEAMVVIVMTLVEVLASVRNNSWFTESHLSSQITYVSTFGVYSPRQAE